jgi:hypothetical protein
MKADVRVASEVGIWWGVVSEVEMLVWWRTTDDALNHITFLIYTGLEACIAEDSPSSRDVTIRYNKVNIL